MWHNSRAHQIRGFLSLHILLGTLAPAENATNVRALLIAATAMPVLNVVFGAALAWAAHSSVAVVLLVMSISYSNFITPVVAFALVIGANLGSAINPLIEGGGLKNPITRRLPLGNLINRVVGCALVLPFLEPVVKTLTAIDPISVRLATIGAAQIDVCSLLNIPITTT